jgi:hypothetical protein
MNVMSRFAQTRIVTRQCATEILNFFSSRFRSRARARKNFQKGATGIHVSQRALRSTTIDAIKPRKFRMKSRVLRGIFFVRGAALRRLKNAVDAQKTIKNQ